MNIQDNQSAINLLKSLKTLPMLHMDMTKELRALIKKLVQEGYVDKTVSKSVGKVLKVFCQYEINSKGEELLRKVELEDAIHDYIKKNLTICIESDYDDHVRVALKLGNEQIYYDEVSVR